MGIFQRFFDLFRANAHDVADKLEDESKMLKLMVLDMEADINKATTAIAGAIANEKALGRKLESAKARSDDWALKAQQALMAGREDLARQALAQKAVEDRNIQDLLPMHQSAAQQSIKLKEQLGVLRNKLNEAKSRQGTLIARAQSAKAMKNVNKQLSGVGGTAFGNFDKYEEKILALEAEADAYNELAGENVGLDLEFKKLASDSDVEANLLAMKRQMGLLPNNDVTPTLPPTQN